MLKRIKKIIKTGVFRKAEGLGHFEFKKLTLFYGLNTHGKTTLKDVFHSISEDDPQVLLERESIPNDTSVKQEVDMSFEKNETETTLKFENGAWSPDTLKGKMLIFDNEFTYKNLITGSAISRENRESLSDFILGAEGVYLSEEIRTLKKDAQDQNKALSQPPYLEKIVDANEKINFLTMEVKETESDLERIKEQKAKELDNLANTEKIKQLNDIEVPQLELETVLEEAIDLINTEFRRDYNEVTTEVITKIETHLSNHVSGKNGLSWVTEGFIKHKKVDDCPFCGQALKAVSDLMDAYNNYFNENYKIFAKSISDNLTAAESRLTQQPTSIFSAFRALEFNLEKYKIYSLNINHEVNLCELEAVETSVKTAFEEEKKAIIIAINRKKQEPHKAFDDLSLSEAFNEALSKLKEEIEKTTNNFEPPIKVAKKLKDEHSSLTKTSLPLLRTDLKKKIGDIDKKIARLREDASCTKYSANLEHIKSLQLKIKIKSTELESQQSEYIEKYFKELNNVYRSLGSKNFKLKCVTNNMGHKKIYNLKIFYRNKEIPSNDVSKVLSESDKRSLSLSVFLSKLHHLEKPEEYIVVLDDPVVSFDDNRITISVDIIKNLIENFKQVIVLTHYPSLVKRLLLAKCDGAYFEVIQNENTSVITQLSRDNFTLSGYELAFNKIYAYVQKEHREDISRDCRVFMEQYLQMRFCKGIREHKIKIASLKDLLSDLKKHDYIDSKKHTVLQNFREGLNPAHHNFKFHGNAEDVRTYAEDLIKILSTL